MRRKILITAFIALASSVVGAYYLLPFCVSAPDITPPPSSAVYDRNGELIAESKVSSISDKNGNREIYWGREEEECRFHVGDIVEVLCGGQVELHMIWEMPFNEAHARKKLPKEKLDRPMTFHLDDSDDCYITVSLTDEYPDHVNVMSCFPAGTLPLDESIVKKLREVFDRCIARIANK